MASPPRPTGLTTDYIGTDYARVVWDEIVSDPVTESVEVRIRTSATTRPRTAAGTWAETTGLAADTVQRTFSDLAEGTSYDVQVRGVNSEANGQWSASLTVRTQEAEQMAILQADLTRLQVGAESTAGTAAAATQRVPYVEASLTPRIERKTLEERGNVLADVDDVIVSRMTELEMTTELSTETCLAPLLGSLASVTPSGSGPRTWTFTPAVTAPSEVGTFTWEWGATDGASSGTRQQGRSSLMRCTGWSIEASTETAQMQSTWMGRARKDLASDSLTALTAPSRWIVPAGAFGVWIDDAWADLGDSKFGTVRSLNVEIDPGITEAMALDGRADLDVSYWRRGRIRGSISLTVDHDGDASDELGEWEAGDLRYVRLAASNGAAAGGLRSITIDAVMRYIDSPDVLASDGAQHTLELVGQLRADAANNILRVAVVNGLSALA